MIGDDIVITLIDVRGDGVRIGFDAPRGVTIQRAEVVAAVRDSNTGAAASAAKSGDLLVGLLNRARAAEAAAPSGASTPEPAEPAAEAPTPPPANAAPPKTARRRTPPKPTPPTPRT